jgi:hypothetical protein
MFLFNLFVGGWSFDYCLFSIFGKDIPFVLDMICGVFTAEVTVPLSIVCFILRLCGIHVPFFGG